MATRRLLHPHNVRELLERRYANNRSHWLAGDGVWPLAVSLGTPNESDARQHGEAVLAWVSAWRNWHGPGNLDWHERQWRTLGTQNLPKRLSLANPAEVARWLGEETRWTRAGDRYQRLAARWPAMGGNLIRHFDVLADYNESDFNRLEALLAWLDANPQSNLYPRQLPIPGMDSKWLDGRKALITNLTAFIRAGDLDSGDFFERCGLKSAPRLLRLRILDRELQTCAGGLSDITAPVPDLARLHLPARCVIVVENVQTGLAFEHLPGGIVLMGLGYGIEVLGELPWLDGKPCLYWGDLDTHGFAILSKARACLPEIESVLMDEATLMANKALWTEEAQQHGATELPRLTNDEQHVFAGLKMNRWGMKVRLEQERIPWDMAWNTLRHRAR